MVASAAAQIGVSIVSKHPGSAFRIANKIRRLRFDHGEMTQQELADRVGVTRQTVNAIELGKYSPSLEVAFRIANVFAVGIEEVFSYEAETQMGREKRS